ncbi:MAG: hypothetical protein KC613_12960 [Myxococcales bacterium]|nr:hypothetical protein [Myxococcales bacterium]MCB9526425.1 hypothetical protein [Myxococcales bacterium]
MELELNTPSEFVDAARLWTCLDAATGAPGLYGIASARFVGAPATHVDEAALKVLVDHGFLQVPRELANAIEKFRRLVQDTTPQQERLEGVYRRMRTAAIQLRRVDKSLDGSNLLKKKTELWEERQRQDDLGKELETLKLERARIESYLEKSGTLLRHLLDTIYQDHDLRDAHWVGERPVVVTYDGQFLHDYLREMNPANFVGRSLAEILEIGPSLA